MIVRDGEVSSSGPVDGGPSGDSTYAPNWTVDDVLDLIERAIQMGTDVDVVYDPVSGQPLDVIIDPEAVAVTPWPQLALRLQPIASLAQPTSLVARPGRDELWIAERPGRVRLVGYPSATEVISAFRNHSLEAASLTLDEALQLIDSGLPIKVVLIHDVSDGADVILDCAGVADTFKWSIPALRKGGRIAAVGIPVERVDLDFQEFVLYEKELVGVRATAGEMRHVLPLVANGSIRAKELITHRFPLEEFAEALATFNERRDGAMKVIVEP